MGKHGKHEEHVNHERWLVSYADMVTLLFALFVVLYAMGVTELKKLQLLKKSIQFAFHIAGEGKTNDDGIFEAKKGAGELPEAAPLINAQDGPMQEFLKETLKNEFEELTGKSIEILVTNDSVRVRAPLSAFFDEGRPYPLKKDVVSWLNKIVLGSLKFTSRVNVKILSSVEIIGERSDGRRFDNQSLLMERLLTLRRFVTMAPQVLGDMVTVTFAQSPDAAAPPGGRAHAVVGWEDRAQLLIDFNNLAADASGPPTPAAQSSKPAPH